MKPEARRFIFSTLGSSIVVFNMGFQIGAFDTFSYQTLLLMWVVATVVLLANFTMVKENRFLRLPGIIALLGPSVLLTTFVFVPLNFAEISLTRLIVLLLGFSIFLVTAPYVVYTIIRVTQNDPRRVFYKRRHLIASIGIVAAMAVAGFLIGENHTLFITCFDFERAGDYVPSDCSLIS